MKVRIQMLSSLLRKSLLLKVGEQILRFDNEADFEFALASRAGVPAAKVSELVRLTPLELMREAESIRQVEKRVVDVLSKSIREPGSIGDLMRAVDVQLFSHDYQWRPIMQALAEQPNRFNQFKQLAIIKYAQYLASHQDLLREIYAHKPNVARQSGHESESDSFSEESCDTLILEVAHPPRSNKQRLKLKRLPKGERVTISRWDGETVEVMLSRHLFLLGGTESIALVDDAGTAHPVKQGLNVVGRHPDSDLMVSERYRDVSRIHMIIELTDSAELAITDLSLHGTFLGANVLQ